MFKNILNDLKHYQNAGQIPHLGFWIGANYRFGNWCTRIRSKPLKIPLFLAYKATATPYKFFRCVYLPPATEIGPGLCLHHPQNILISSRTVIGENCTLYQDVTIGGGGVKPGLPTIGNNVSIFAGAKILGGITIGDNVEIGANAVVTFDVPADSVVPSPQSRAIPRALIEKMRRGRKKS